MNVYARCREKTYDEERLKKEDGSTWQSVSGGARKILPHPYVNPLDGFVGRWIHTRCCTGILHLHWRWGK